MQLTLAHTLLLLPLTTATASTSTMTNILKRNVGDPDSMVSDLSKPKDSPCMALCGLKRMPKACYTKSSRPQIDIDCMCKSSATNTAPGQAWEDATKRCFSEPASNGTSQEPYDCLGCVEKDYEEGKMLAICKALTEKPEKKNDTQEAMVEVFLNLTETIMHCQVYGPKRSAATAAGPSDVVGIAGAVLAAAVGYAAGIL
ncbi:hypothetical protein N657DRAFT_105278 [Parathielavia appendiculata]|uniref:Uncharacterized protein n=1 Tax=Parathielavia appendiculata TaxID=2587402 RepID=A0AAN6TYA9_9PEZI|nr:hypothetical protein N657DRAFT_105278 [Parathielavia appendiculata]